MTTYGVLNQLTADMSVCPAGAGAASQAGTVPVSQVPLVSGAELYAEPGVTGLNTQPVDDHCALALLGCRLGGQQQFPIPPGGGLGLARSATEGRQPQRAVAPVARPPVDLELLCTKLLSEGSVALVRGDLLGSNADAGVGAGPAPAHAQGQPAGTPVATRAAAGAAPTQPSYVCLDGIVTLDPILPFTANQFAQRFWAKVDGESKCVTRVFSKGGERFGAADSMSAYGAESKSATSTQSNGEIEHSISGLAVRSPEDWHVRDYTDFATERQKLIATASAPADSIIAYPNGLGILYKAQRAYRRLEAIFATIERMQSGVNSKTIISGYVGSAEQAHSELRRPDRDVALFPSGATVHRIASTSAIDQLMREFETLLPLYLRRLHFVHFAGDDQLSGISRRLAMAPMLAFVEKVRGQLAQILGLLGAQVSFERIRVEGFEERAQKYDLLRKLREDGVVSNERLRVAALALL